MHGGEGAVDMTGRRAPGSMLPERRRARPAVESGLLRLVATGGIVAIGVVLGAILDWRGVAGWIVGLVVSLVSVVLAGLLWSTREL